MKNFSFSGLTNFAQNKSEFKKGMTKRKTKNTSKRLSTDDKMKENKSLPNESITENHKQTSTNNSKNNNSNKNNKNGKIENFKDESNKEKLENFLNNNAKKNDSTKSENKTKHRTPQIECSRESSLLCLLLTLATLWLSLSLYNFTKTLVFQLKFL